MSAVTIEEENKVITQALQFLIGNRYVPAVRAYISELTGRPRVHGPGEFISREFDLLRISIVTEADSITGFHFG